MTIDQLAQLGVEAQVKALSEIWRYIAEANTPLPLTEEEKQLLRNRLTAERDLPGKSWEDLRSELESSLP